MDDFSGSHCPLWGRGSRDKLRSAGLPLPLILVPASLPCQIGIQEEVVLVLSHGTESVLPTLSGVLYRTNNNLGILDFEFYFGAETALFEEHLGDADAL